MFKSTFGPLGLNKLIVKDEDFDLVSSNGLYIINELDYEHPTAEILIKAGKIQGDEIGDGVSTLMILIGELIKKGFDLKSLGVPFPIVIKAYAKSIAKVKEILGEIAIEEELDDELKTLIHSARFSELSIQALECLSNPSCSYDLNKIEFGKIYEKLIKLPKQTPKEEILFLAMPQTLKSIFTIRSKRKLHTLNKMN